MAGGGLLHGEACSLHGGSLFPPTPHRSRCLRSVSPVRLLPVACALRSRPQLLGVYWPSGWCSLLRGYQTSVHLAELEVGVGSFLLVAGPAGQLHVAPVVRAAQFVRDHVLHLKLVIRIPFTTVVADPVVLSVEPVSFVFGLLVILSVVVVIGSADIGCLWPWCASLRSVREVVPKN